LPSGPRSLSWLFGIVFRRLPTFTGFFNPLRNSPTLFFQCPGVVPSLENLPSPIRHFAGLPLPRRYVAPRALTTRAPRCFLVGGKEKLPEQLNPSSSETPPYFSLFPLDIDLFHFLIHPRSWYGEYFSLFAFYFPPVIFAFPLPSSPLFRQSPWDRLLLRLRPLFPSFLILWNRIRLLSCQWFHHFSPVSKESCPFLCSADVVFPFLLCVCFFFQNGLRLFFFFLLFCLSLF